MVELKTLHFIALWQAQALGNGEIGWVKWTNDSKVSGLDF